MQKQLADVGQNGRVADGNPILGQQGEEFSQDMIDRRGGLEILERAEEFGGDPFGIHASSVKELLLALPVNKAERRIIIQARHAAAAAVSGSLLAAVILFLFGLR